MWRREKWGASVVGIATGKHGRRDLLDAGLICG